MPPFDIQAFLKRENLPDAYRADFERWFAPLADAVDVSIDAFDRPMLLGLHGAQGTGKSTLAALIAGLLEGRGRRVAVLSQDDFYLTREARGALARRAHPLLATRGVPGTHDLPLLRETLMALAGSAEVALPRFDKSRDDRHPPENWPRLRAPVDLIILEGWFTGTPAEEPAALRSACNPLEAEEDADGHWRAYVNEVLRESWTPLFAGIDLLLMLRAPSFEAIARWRQLQEQKLRAATGGGMSPTQVEHFMQYFERLTRHALNTVPALADICFELDEDHRIVQRRDRRR